MSMEHHKEILKYFCRLCGNIVPERALKNKNKYRTLGWKSATSKDVHYVLLNHYKQDTKQDKYHIHPPKVCIACKFHVASFSKYKTTSEKSVFKFEEHSGESCILCESFEDATNLSKERPPKRKSSLPGQDSDDENQRKLTF